LVVLLTDFGERDGFVGVLKGVMLSINPSLRFIDLTHHIEPFNITEGSLTSGEKLPPYLRLPEKAIAYSVAIKVSK
jgi:S-adenosylmethionine hydrolase